MHARSITAAVLLAALSAGATQAAAPSKSVDRGLCGFPLEVRVVHTRARLATTSALKFAFDGPARITLRNATTGKSTAISSSAAQTIDTRTGTIGFGAGQLWWWTAAKHIHGVPFARTSAGLLVGPHYVLSGATHATVVDPCALVGPPPPPDTPRKAPWALPRYALTHIARAGLVPVIGAVIRHEHAHLDVIVEGTKVVVPAGIGLAEPADTGHGVFAQVANSPLHTHDASGTLHIESDRRTTFTLGALFLEWGVRLDQRCVGAYCAGGGKELRAFVGGRRVSGDPARVVLHNHEEVALVFGGPGSFRSVPSVYPASS